MQSHGKYQLIIYSIVVGLFFSQCTRHADKGGIIFFTDGTQLEFVEFLFIETDPYLYSKNKPIYRLGNGNIHVSKIKELKVLAWENVEHRLGFSVIKAQLSLTDRRGNIYLEEEVLYSINVKIFDVLSASIIDQPVVFADPYFLNIDKVYFN